MDNYIFLVSLDTGTTEVITYVVTATFEAALFFDVVNEIQASFLSHLNDSYRSQSVSPNMIGCIGEFQ